jgi:hypothetical protein
MTERLLKFKHDTILKKLLGFEFDYFYNHEYLSDDVWLAGGSLRGIIGGKNTINDFDMFFRNQTACQNLVSRLEKHKILKLVFSCSNNKLKTYSGIIKPNDKSFYIKIQLITPKFYDSVEELLNSFDINACRLLMDNNFLYTYRSVLNDIKHREINLHNVTHPNATFKRMLKYQSKGYRITNHAIDFFVDKVYDMGANDIELQSQHYID